MMDEEKDLSLQNTPEEGPPSQEEEFVALSSEAQEAAEEDVQKKSKKKQQQESEHPKQVDTTGEISEELLSEILSDIEKREENGSDSVQDDSMLDLLKDGEKKREYLFRKKDGIGTILNRHLIHYERLPMLEVVSDRLVRVLSTSLRQFTSDNVEVIFNEVNSIRFGDYLNSMSLPSMIGIFKAKEWDNYGLVILDSAIVYSVVDVLLGGRRGTPPLRVDGRTYTTIERNLIQRMVRLILKDLCWAFEPITEVYFAFERLEVNPRFASIARPENGSLVISLRAEMEERGGKIEILFPYATIEPIRELLLQNYMGEKFGRDSIWENHLATELWDTDVRLEAKIKPELISLNDVLKWKVGKQLLFECAPDSSVMLSCGDKSLFSGKMGQVGGKAAIKIEEVLFTGEEGEME